MSAAKLADEAAASAADAVVFLADVVPEEERTPVRAKQQVAVHGFPSVVCRSPMPPVPRAHCHRHIDTVFVAVVLVAMLILVIAECVSTMRRSP